MSSDIVLTAGVRANLLQLQKTSDLITQTQTKLATGKRVNSALDNPVNYFTAQGLQNRAGDLSNLLDSMGSAFNTIQAANNWATGTDIAAAGTQLSAALTTLRSQAQSLSSNLSTVQIRQDFTKAMINTLNNGADSLTLADSNEEGANLLALQTRQQLSTTALSLAAQADQNVLRLFQ